MRRLVAGRVVLALALVAVAACGDDSGGSAEDAAGAAGTIPEGIAGLPGGEGATIDEEGTDPRPALPEDIALPIVFVHGFAGSAQQYESQAQRFVANGWPEERLLAYDHDGAGVDIPGYVDGVDAVVDQARADFGVEQVYLVGHSRGTFVSGAYLSDPSRAVKVAGYVAIDGEPCPEVVPCLAPTQESNPGQSHVEVATSAESFAAQYEFLVGEAPDVVDVVPQRDPIVLSGRAVDFPENTGREGVDLDVWEVDPTTGGRIGDEPHVSFTLGRDGVFGPFVARSGAHYEWALSAPDSPTVHHLYLQPYVRSSHLVRLLSSPPDGATRSNTNTGEGHTSLIAIRMREWYAEDDPDLPGDQSDRLEVSLAGGEPVDVLADHVGNGAIGVHLHDDAATPGETALGPLPYFSTQPFQSGVDVYLPASDAANGTITVTNIPRGDRARPQILNVADWPSSGHSVSVIFTDHPVD